MGRCSRPPAARLRLAAAALAIGLAGCNNAYVQVSGGTPLPPGPPPPGGSVSVTTSSALVTLLTFGLINFAMTGGAPFYAAPPMDPERRVVEHDCTRPIEDMTANLRCR